MSVYILKNGERHGPYEESVVAGWLMNGTCSPQDLARRDGMNGWQPLSSISLLPNRQRSGSGGILIALLGLFVTGVSFLISIWGYWYIIRHQWGGLASRFGMSNGTYEIAQGATVIGLSGFILGVVLLLDGGDVKVR